MNIMNIMKKDNEYTKRVIMNIMNVMKKDNEYTKRDIMNFPLKFMKKSIAQSAGAVAYTDCTSAEG